MSKASSLGLKELRIHFGMFDYEFHCICGPRSGVSEYVSWRFDDDDVASLEAGPDDAGLTFSRAGYQPILWIPRAPKTSREYAALAHEMLHVVRHLMEWAGVPFSRESNEAYCHALGYGVASIIDGLKNK